jgi:hypothetical protein
LIAKPDPEKDPLDAFRNAVDSIKGFELDARPVRLIP